MDSRILLVEDNEMNRDMLIRRLTRRGYHVFSADNGREGLLAAQKRRPDLILMDLSLPEISGWDLTRLLKSDARTGSIPIVALTAHALEEDKTKALAVGCDEYIPKPVDMTVLLETLKRLLPEDNLRVKAA